MRGISKRNSPGNGEMSWSHLPPRGRQSKFQAVCAREHSQEEETTTPLSFLVKDMKCRLYHRWPNQCQASLWIIKAMEMKQEMHSTKMVDGIKVKIYCSASNILSTVAHRENNIFTVPGQLGSSSHAWPCPVAQGLRQSEAQAHTWNKFVHIDWGNSGLVNIMIASLQDGGHGAL